MIIGDKTLIAFDIGPMLANSKQLQQITIWVGNRCINPIDDEVYLPCFYTKLEEEIIRLENNDLFRPDFNGLLPGEIFQQLEIEDNYRLQVLRYDISTCPAKCYYFEGNFGGTLLYSYWDSRHEPEEEIGQVFEIDIPKDVLLKTMKEALGNLSNVWV